MRPATAVLGDLPSCSRRASAGLLRPFSGCQPGRSGRLARVVPATAPPSSPTSSSSTIQSGTSVDATGQPRNGNGQVVATTLAQKPHAAAPQPQSHVSSGHPAAAATSSTPLAATTVSSSSSTTNNPAVTQASPAPEAPRTAPVVSSQAVPSAAPGQPSSSSSPGAAPSPGAVTSASFSPTALPQPPSDLRVVPPHPNATASSGTAGRAEGAPSPGPALAPVPPTAPPGSPSPQGSSSLSHSNGSSGNGNGFSISVGFSNGHGYGSTAAGEAAFDTRASAAPAASKPTSSGLAGAGAAGEAPQPPSPSGSKAAPHAAVAGSAAALAAGPLPAGGGAGAAAAAPQLAVALHGAVAAPSGQSAPPSQAGAAVSSSPAVAAPPGNAQSLPQALLPHQITPGAAGAVTATTGASGGAAAAPQPPGTPSPPGTPMAVGNGGGSLTAGTASNIVAVTSMGTIPAASTNGAAATASSGTAGLAATAGPASPNASSSTAAGGSGGALTAAATQSSTATPPATGSSASTAGNSNSSTNAAPAAPAAGHSSTTNHPHATGHSSGGSSASSSAGGGGAGAAAHASAAPISSASSGFQLRPIHVVIFAAIFLGGALFAALTLQFTADLEFHQAATTVARRVARSVAFRQLCVIACAICLVRFGLNNVLRALAKFSASPVQWDKSKVYYILKEVYSPLELLLFIAAICTIADSFVPQLIAVPRSTVSTVVRSTLSVSFIIGAATVVFNLKSRFCKENAWQSEMNGDVTAQRRWEAYDKLGTFVIYTITFVLGIQALGLEVTSVLAIGGIGGLAIGLAGREICENILNGFLIMSTSPFEVGDEVHFFHSNKVVEGMVLDIGWYRTTIRSYEREVFVIPNAVFSKNIVLNITRKNREWRFFEMICVRVQDVHKVNAIIQDIRRIVRNDQRIITKLHRRIFLDKLTHEDCRIYVSFYVEAQNRESFMAVKQDLLLAFVDCVERNGAKLAVPRTTVQMEPEVVEALSPMLGAAAAMAAAKVTMDVQQAAGNAAAAAAARALTDGRTITAEVTAVPSSPSQTSGSSAAAGGTTATSGKAAAAATGSSPGSPGKGTAAGPAGGGGGATVVVAADGAGAVAASAGTGGAAAAAAAPSAQGSSKGSDTGLTWLLSKLAQVLFET